MTSELETDLARRFRQSIQGCVLHSHGPVQAWVSIVTAAAEGKANVERVLDLIVRESEAKQARLEDSNDPAARKERVVVEFVKTMLGNLNVNDIRSALNAEA